LSIAAGGKDGSVTVWNMPSRNTLDRGGLPSEGAGQKNVPPTNWSLTIGQWLDFMDKCMATEKWQHLVRLKTQLTAAVQAKDLSHCQDLVAQCKEHGVILPMLQRQAEDLMKNAQPPKGDFVIPNTGDDGIINLYDVVDNFVKPWTEGTGSSVALLYNSEPAPAEAMLSHAWAGGIMEVYRMFTRAVFLNELELETRVFYCGFSLYQPQDGHPDGLSIDEQLAQDPFAQIINVKPKSGMFVIHTTLAEVYVRMWCVFEADAGVVAGLPIRGLFDTSTMTASMLDSAAEIDTSQSEVGSEADRVMLTGIINQHGGFERLNDSIAELRRKMKQDLEDAHSKDNTAAYS